MENARYWEYCRSINILMCLENDSSVQLTRSNTSAQIASSSWTVVAEGIFAGQKKQVLRIEPCSIDIDLIILTFIIMETKRREGDGYVDKYHILHDEEPQGECGVSAEADGNAEGGAIGEL